PEVALRWLLEWLFHAQDAGSGSLLSVWSWNRTTPWTTGQDRRALDQVRATTTCLPPGAPRPPASAGSGHHARSSAQVRSGPGALLRLRAARNRRAGQALPAGPITP